MVKPSGFCTQVGLRLWEMDATKRDSIGKAAEKIGAASETSIKLIQEYFEEKKEDRK